MEDCIFCQIVAGESPASVFYEDDVVLGLMDISPVTKGHAMIIPKRHVPYLAQLDEATGRHLWTITQRTAAAIRQSGIRCEGINLFLADGEAASQEGSCFHRWFGPSRRRLRSWAWTKRASLCAPTPRPEGRHTPYALAHSGRGDPIGEMANGHPWRSRTRST